MPTPRIDGIDVSHWNPVSSSDDIPTGDVLPLMSCKATEGRGFVSRTFRPFWDLFKAKGARYRGAYHWLRSDSPIIQQADHFTRVMEGAGFGDVGDIIQLDWETTPNIPLNTSDHVAQWCDIIEGRFGPRIIVYSSDWLPDSTLDPDARGEFFEWREAFPDYPYWHANYNTTLRSTGGWAESEKYRADVWQWSSTTPVPGFAAGIDVNHVFNWRTLDRLSLRDTVTGTGPPEEETADMSRSFIVTTGARDVTDPNDPRVLVWIEMTADGRYRQHGSGSTFRSDEFGLLTADDLHAELVTTNTLATMTADKYGVFTAAGFGYVASRWDQRVLITAPVVNVPPVQFPPIEFPPVELPPIEWPGFRITANAQPTEPTTEPE